jgi:hypothetical protein
MADFTYHRPVHLQVAADEVLREVGPKPQLILRIAVRGASFPLRAIEPFARIEINDKVVESLFTETDDDERGLRSYFPTDVRLRGNLIVGYGSEVTAVIPFDKIRLKPTRLDEEKIEGSFHRVTMRDPGAFRVRD